MRATNGAGYYLIAWQETYPGPCCDWDIHAQELDATGNVTALAEIVMAASADDEYQPRVAARSAAHRDYLVTWQRSMAAGEAVYASHWGELGTTANHQLPVASYAFWNCVSPAAAAGANNFLTVYSGDSAGDPSVYKHIYGRLWWAQKQLFLPLVRK